MIRAGYGYLCLIAGEGDIAFGEKAVVGCRHVTPERPEFPSQAAAANNMNSIISILNGLKGFFSGILASRDRLILFRDHVGHMPLAYRRLDRGLFAAALERWALGGGAEQLQPGHILVFDGKVFEATKWYEACVRSVNDPVETLAECLADAVDLYVPEKSCLAFSGGLDSSIIAHLAVRSGKHVDAVTVGYEGCLDFAWAVEAAELLGIRVKKVAVDDEALREVVAALESRFPARSTMDLAIASIFYVASKNFPGNFLVTGHGPDELFGGYQKYVNMLERFGVERAARSMKQDIEQLHSTNLERDELASALAGATLLAPYLSKDIYELALSIDPKMKLREIDGGVVRKWVLRKAAERLGLPTRLVERPKKAAQYSSGTQRGIRRILAKKKIGSGRI